MLKNLQYALGFLIGFFATLTLAIGVVAGIEAMTGRALPFKVLLVPAAAIAVGIVAARLIGRLDLTGYFTARYPRANAPPPPPAPRQPRQKRHWSFHLVGTLMAIWAVALVGIIVLFGPFGFADTPSAGVRLLKILACTVAIIGLGGFLLRKEFAKLMSRQSR